MFTPTEIPTIVRVVAACTGVRRMFSSCVPPSPGSHRSCWARDATCPDRTAAGPHWNPEHSAARRGAGRTQSRAVTLSPISEQARHLRTRPGSVAVLSDRFDRDERAPGPVCDPRPTRPHVTRRGREPYRARNLHNPWYVTVAPFTIFMFN